MAQPYAFGRDALRLAGDPAVAFAPVADCNGVMSLGSGQLNSKRSAVVNLALSSLDTLDTERCAELHGSGSSGPAAQRHWLGWD